MAQAYRRVLDTITAESGLPEEAILDLRGAPAGRHDKSVVTAKSPVASLCRLLTSSFRVFRVTSGVCGVKYGKRLATGFMWLWHMGDCRWSACPGTVGAVQVQAEHKVCGACGRGLALSLGCKVFVCVLLFENFLL